MSDLNITFIGDIIAHARDRGVSLTHQEAAAINANLNAVATLQSGGISFDFGDHSVDLGEAVEAMSRGYGKPVEQPVTMKNKNPRIPAGANATERAIELNRAAKAGADEIKARQAETLVKTFGNPFASGGNRTHAAFVSINNPSLAARLKAEAGAKS